MSDPSDASQVNLDAFADPLAYNPALRVAIHVLRATAAYQRQPADPSATTKKPDTVADARECAAHIALGFLAKYA